MPMTGKYTRMFLVLHAVQVLLLGAALTMILLTIDGIKQREHDSCLSRVENLARANRSAEAFIRIEQANPFATVSPETIADRIEAYRAGIRIIPRCPAP